MSPEKLMIGDLVLYKDKPIMVWEIDEYYDRINTEPDGYNAIRCIEISDIKPIPLTPEILEKNGFERVNGEYQDVFYVYDGIELLIDNGYTLFGQCKMPIKYVHELQHVLRLCKINKAIIL